MLTQRFDDAFALARRLHDGQTRKSTAIPYLSHLMAVSAIVLEQGGDEDQAIAGLLHDGPEDAGGRETLAIIEARFGPGVAGIVADCTDSWEDPKPAWHPRKQAYLEALSGKPQRSLLVSLADKTHNAEAIGKDRLVVGEAVWARFSVSRDDTLWYYNSLAALFARRMPGPGADRLGRAVAAMAAPLTSG